MVFKQVSVLLLSILITQICTTSINSRDSKNVDATSSLDDALALLYELGQSVLGNILAGHDQLEDLRADVSSHSTNVQLAAEVDVDAENETLAQQLEELKLLAFAAEKNISICLVDNEDRLSELPTDYNKQIADCISSLKTDTFQVLNDSIYKIDIVINNVNGLNFTLGQCDVNDDECISKVIDQINAAAENLPLQIQVEVDNAKRDLDVVKAKIQDCADNGLSGYVREGSGIIEEITECVNGILTLLMLQQFDNSDSNISGR